MFNRLRYAKRVAEEQPATEATTTASSIRDSGTSSPINPDADHRPTAGAQISSRNFEHQSSDDAEEEMSDSNDSVFSSGSSIDSILNFNGADQLAPHDDGESLDIRDLYVGGCCSSWRDAVIAALGQRNVTYRMSDLYAPPKHERQYRSDADDDEATTTAKPLETCGSNDSGIGRSLHQALMRSGGGRRMFNPGVLSSSRVLLFVISGETRSLASMTLAAHCIGLGLNVVLCVQMLPERCHIGDDQVNLINDALECARKIQSHKLQSVVSF